MDGLVYDDRETINYEYMIKLLFRNIGKEIRGKNRFFKYNSPTTFEFKNFNCLKKNENEIIIFNEQIIKINNFYKNAITLDRRYIVDIKYENLEMELLYIRFPSHSVSLSII